MFVPNWFVDISRSHNGTTFLEKKLQALGMYTDEMRSFPHARSLEAVKSLARMRGASIGVEVVEGFMVGRCII
jgi:N-acetylglucosamine malate deacetylase 1